MYVVSVWYVIGLLVSFILEFLRFAKYNNNHEYVLKRNGTYTETLVEYESTYIFLSLTPHVTVNEV